MEATAPTHEQFKKFKFDKAHVDQKTNRTAYRRISQVEALRNRGDIADAQYRAAEKLYKHMIGATGARVQHDEDHMPLNADTEYPITYHNQKVAEACKSIGNPRTWDALLSFIDESKTVTQIGQRSGVKCHKISRGVGLGLIISGLDTLAQLWGLSTRQSSPP